MRSSFSSIENQQNSSDEQAEEFLKPKKEFRHRRSQKLFDVREAQALKDEIDQSFKNAIGKLSIFNKPDETAESIELFARQLQPARPITPTEDEISNETIPRDVEQLLKLIRRRLRLEPSSFESTRLSSDDLSQLATVVLTQIRSKWFDIEEMRVQHPLLSIKRNHELIRRLFVNIVMISTNIYEHAVNEAQIFHDRYVFSHAANMTRLRTLLADRINTLINVHSLREYLAYEMIEEERLKKGLILEENFPKSARKRLDKNGVLSQNRPDTRDLIEQAGKSYRYYPESYRLDSKRVLHQLVTNMPDFSRFRRLPVVLPPMDRQFLSSFSLKKSSSHPKIHRRKSPIKVQQAATQQHEQSEQTSPAKRIRCYSMPNIHEKFLCEELDFDFSAMKTLKNKTTDLMRENYFIDEEKKRKEAEKLKFVSNRDDLIRLTTRAEIDQKDDDDDIPPLIKVLTSSHDCRERIEKSRETVLAVVQRRKKFLNELKENVRDEPLCPQPAAVEKVFKNITFRISDITLANFYFQSSFLLASFPTIFNNYFGDIDDETVAYLDRNLHIGQQIKEVYEQLLSTIDLKRSFQLDTDKYVVRCPDKLNLSAAQASSTLVKTFAERIYNEILRKKNQAPWSKLDNDRQRWISTPDPRLVEKQAEAKKKRSNKNRGKGLFEPTVNMSLVPNPETIASYQPRDARQTRDFQTWKDYWKNTYTEEDYLKYLSTQSTDYLHHIFHIHDPLPEDNRLSEEDQELLDRRNQALKEREAKIAELKERKRKFEEGHWNAETVSLGGLGRDPVLNPDEDPFVLFQREVENQKPKAKRIDLFDPVAHEKAKSSKRLLTAILSNVKQIDAQKRLEKIWKTLRMKDNERLHMVIKYSTLEYIEKIEEALIAWEFIADLISKREKFIGDLENFERTASDANRFFQPGPIGSSKMRLSECRRRTYLHNQLSILEKQIEEQWNSLKKLFGDTVTYNGRNYLNKMQFDKLEMLYYLQEERRLNYLHSFTSATKRGHLNTSFNDIL